MRTSVAGNREVNITITIKVALRDRTRLAVNADHCASNHVPILGTAHDLQSTGIRANDKQ